MNFQKTSPKAFQNFLLAKYERFTGQVTNRSLPYFMAIDPSSICQLRCPFCPTGIENAAKKNGNPIHLRNRMLMSSELFDGLIDEMGDILFYVLLYNWGEPLLNKHLSGFIAKAKTYQIHTEIHTNLSLRLSDQQIETLLTSGIDEVDASIDGFSKESYKTYRQGGDFELARSNLARMAKMRDQLGLSTALIWNYLVFSFNENEIKDCEKYCKDIGVTFNRREAFINVEEKPDWLPSYRKHELEHAEPAAHVGSGDQAKPVRESSCSWHYAMSVINADGAVSPCCVPWEDKFDFGKVIPERVKFKDIWNNAQFEKSRAAFADKPLDGYGDVHTICEACPYPPSIMNQYVPIEKEVIRNFLQLERFRGTDFDKAFHLLDDQEKFVNFCRMHYDELFDRDPEKIALPVLKSNPFEWIRQKFNRL